MADTTELQLPSSLPYPLVVTRVTMHPGQLLKKHTTVITFKYWEMEPIPLGEVEEEDSDESSRQLVKVESVGTFESPIEGEIQQVFVNVGDEIANARHTIANILEACTHPIQYGGLCAMCGQSVEDEDYSGYSNRDRAPISMSHGTANLKVSKSEAEKIETDSTKRLINEGKLILVVDLDQTVIHATVDPTVGEWRQDPTNPNYESLKNVKSFSLKEDIILPSSYTGPKPAPNIRWYYVKLRPGLEEFLEKVSKMYELHIYTMATRAYAKSIAKLIDPEEKYFGDRILSRDESGSLTQKSLKRLFPVDTSMVVVIDDRGDVWNWSPNLIKVVPYDFFVGIGDINSSFLPRQNALLGPSKKKKSVADLEDQLNAAKSSQEGAGTSAERASSENDESAGSESSSDEKESPEPSAHSESGVEEPAKEDEEDVESPVDRIMAIAHEAQDSVLLVAQATERTASLEQQEQDRPLAKLQHDLDKIIKDEEDSDSENGATEKENAPIMHNLLSDDDTELETLGQALFRVHNEYFYEIEKNNGVEPRVENIMDGMRDLVFKEYTFLFSGILPLGTNMDSADIVIWTRSFGATVVSDYVPSVTHVISKNPGTFKVKLAKSLNPNVKIVNPDWIFKCISLWEKVPEDDFTLEFSPEDVLPEAQLAKYRSSFGMSEGAVVADIDWDQLSEEMKEFVGSDYDSEEDESGSEDDSNEKKRSRDETDVGDSVKRARPDEEESDDELAKELMLELEEDDD
ncbi:unnamed protein product [Kuraishia capsulata CBS 1993]|uniref:RNA polymerase II subunit A C-terminal domain phosphatase n=1 Tax=Kuraishia capsulata CBS 1993 TaxID=1382522 RepID=W6MG19_9ASCO|nr:uncharacterized protein KUCA_T00000896001 [Kuraishia capsulata CBS 1993]CDK24929.1 unnamed protein product [Kuraishia capsulata CBS 1993]